MTQLTSELNLQRRRPRPGLGKRLRQPGIVVTLAITVLVSVLATTVANRWLARPETTTPKVYTDEEQRDTVKKIQESANAVLDQRLGILNAQHKQQLEGLQKLLAQRPPVNEEEKKKWQDAIDVLKKSNDELKKEIKGLQDRKEVINEVADNFKPGGPAASNDPPDSGKGQAVPLPEPKKRAPTDDDTEQTKKNDDKKGLARLLTFIATVINPELASIIGAVFGLGGGDLFGTVHEGDAKTVVEKIRELYEKGDEIKVQNACNRICETPWGDPAVNIKNLRKALAHKDMRARLGEDKAKQLEAMLEEVELIYAHHPLIFKKLGREKTLRLLQELPPLVAPPDGQESQAIAKFTALCRKPYEGVVGGSQGWREGVILVYINDAKSAKGGLWNTGSLRPWNLPQSSYLSRLEAIAQGKSQQRPVDPHKPNAQKTKV